MTTAHDLLRRVLACIDWNDYPSTVADIEAYLEKRDDAAQRLKHLQEFAFCDTDPEKSYIESEKLLNCPHCGGSGHVGDAPKDEPVAYGIIDPDYARIFTIARCLAWSEGYAMVMHGSFTRDLDLVAIPWADNTCEPEHLLRRILSATNLRVTGTPNIKPHRRLVWTLLFPDSSDPRFVDFSVVNATTDVVGMEVCLDVSTGESALDRRIFGRVIDLKQDPEDGPIIYAKEESRNFHSPTKTAPREPMTEEEIGRYLDNKCLADWDARIFKWAISIAERHHGIGGDSER